MTTPNDQNFEAFPNDPAGVNGARTLGSFVVEGHRTDAGGAGDLSTFVSDAASVTVSIGSGQILGLNYGYIFTADWWQFRSVSAADNFKLASLSIESSTNGWDDVITVSGYNDSGMAVSATVDLTASGSYGSISYTKLGGAVFLESAEFARHCTLDDAHFVATLLTNSGVAAISGVAAGWEAWLGAHSRAELVVALIGDPAVAGAQFGTQGLWLV